MNSVTQIASPKCNSVSFSSWGNYVGSIAAAGNAPFGEGFCFQVLHLVLQDISTLTDLLLFLLAFCSAQKVSAKTFRQLSHLNSVKRVPKQYIAQCIQ